LGKYREHAKEAIPALIAALKDDYTWVPIYAAGSLTSLTEKDFIAENAQFSPERWRKWWYEEAKQKVPKATPADKQSIEKVRAGVANTQGEMLLRGGGALPAATKFMEAVRLDSHVARYHANLGLAMLTLKDYERALRCFDTAMAMDPKFTDAYLNKGGVYSEKAGDLRAAAVEHQAAMRAAKAAGDAPTERAERQKLAENLLDAERLENLAINQFEQAIARDEQGRRWAAHLEIGRIYKRRGNWEQAVGPLEKARELNGREITVHLELALTYYALDQYFRAWKEIQAIEELGGKPDPGFRKKVEDRVRNMGAEPGKGAS
jgi:tetratricopeptide (TPR) repeat protein